MAAPSLILHAPFSSFPGNVSSPVVSLVSNHYACYYYISVSLFSFLSHSTLNQLNILCTLYITHYSSCSHIPSSLTCIIMHTKIISMHNNIICPHRFRLSTNNFITLWIKLMLYFSSHGSKTKYKLSKKLLHCTLELEYHFSALTLFSGTLSSTALFFEAAKINMLRITTFRLV